MLVDSTEPGLEVRGIDKPIFHNNFVVTGAKNNSDNPSLQKGVSRLQFLNHLCRKLLINQHDKAAP
jgi:hypothetical protein